MARSLRLDTALYGAATLVDRLIGFILLPVLTRAVSPTDFGLWTQTAVAAGVLVPVVLFGLPTAIVNFYSGDGVDRRRALARLAVVPLALLALAAGVLWPAAPAVSGAVYGDPAHAAMVPMMLGLLCADAASEFALAGLRCAGRIGTIAGAMIVRSVLRYAAVLWLVHDAAPMADWFGDYVRVQAALAAALVAATALLLPRPGATATAGGPPLRTVLAFSAPLVALALFTSASAFVDRFVLVHLLGLDAVAVYSASMSLASIPSAFYTVLGYTLFPTLARCWQDGRRDAVAPLLGRSVEVFLALCLPVAALIGAAGTGLLPLLSTADYRPPAAVFGLLGVSVCAFGVYQIVLYALLLDGRSREVLGLTLGAAVVNLGLNLMLAPPLGLAGAAGAVALSNTLLAAWAARRVRRVVDWRFDTARAVSIAARAAVAAAPLALLNALAPLTAGRALAGAAAGLALYAVLEGTRRDSSLRGLLRR